MRDASSCLTSYEDFKRSHLDTERLCSEAGFRFNPMVVEAVGGAWGPASVKVFSELAKSKSMITGEPVDFLRNQLLQSLGVILHRENARAVVKRRGTLTCVSNSVLAAATTLQSPSAGEE
jgi:hypothetical protein